MYSDLSEKKSSNAPVFNLKTQRDIVSELFEEFDKDHDGFLNL